MLATIENLLSLQKQDRHLLRLREELLNIDPERQHLRRKTESAHAQLDAARAQARQVETERKRLELEVEGKRQQIERYSLQQFQTKKNEEYRALAQEIQNCKEAISRLEDQQLSLMEQADGIAKEIQRANQEHDAAKKDTEDQLAELTQREASLQKELAAAESSRQEGAEKVDASLRARYERLLKHKGAKALVGVEHGVCGGCHMKLPVQILVICKGQQELPTCPNCGRLLFYTDDMDLTVSD